MEKMRNWLINNKCYDAWMHNAQTCAWLRQGRSINSLLSDAFLWEETPEHRQYWSALSHTQPYMNKSMTIKSVVQAFKALDSDPMLLRMERLKPWKNSAVTRLDNAKL
jgi:hypothetical protein